MRILQTLLVPKGKGRRALTGYEPKLFAHMEMMRRLRSGRVSPGREAEESRAPAGEGEPEKDGSMGGGAARDAHSADGRGRDPTRSASRAREGVPQALRPGMDEQVVVVEESSRSRALLPEGQGVEEGPWWA